MNAQPAPAAVAPVAERTANAVHALALGHRYAPGRGLGRIDFAIASPEVVAVTGANGSGKSTLLRIVAGLLRPTQGTLRFVRAGCDVPPLARRAHVGFLSPELRFYPELTAGENLQFAAETLGLPDPVEATAAALHRVGLGMRFADRAGALSSGMRQRLRLAFAILHRPHVLLLDEPGSHLDDGGRAMLADLVAEHGRKGLVVIATNDEREIGWASRRIALAGTPLPGAGGER